MDAQELRNLQEAYMEVYQEICEAMMDGPRKDRIVKKRHDPDATPRDRATAFNVGVRDDRPRDKNSTGGKGKRYSDFGDRGFGNKNRRRRGLEPLRGDTRPTQAEQVDLYDIILSHLLDEGYAETKEAAAAIMVNMSEEWREGIVEASAAAQRGLPEPHRLKDINKRAADYMRTTPSGRRQLAAQSAGHRERQTPAAQEKAKTTASNLEKMNRINARPRTTKEKNLARHITKSGRLGS
jgi:hypothetical protein